MRGPSFCHVDRIRQLDQEMDVMIDGNQKWQGAIPNFRRMAAIKIYEGSGRDLFIQREEDAIRINLLPRA